MRFRLVTPNKVEYWCAWFAWRPVVTETGYLVWLEHVLRRWNPDYEGAWEYALASEA